MMTEEEALAMQENRIKDSYLRGWNKSAARFAPLVEAVREWASFTLDPDIRSGAKLLRILKAIEDG